MHLGADRGEESSLRACNDSMLAEYEALLGPYPFQKRRTRGRMIDALALRELLPQSEAVYAMYDTIHGCHASHGRGIRLSVFSRARDEERGAFPKRHRGPRRLKVIVSVLLDPA
jgi:hypothetical protein